MNYHLASKALLELPEAKIRWSYGRENPEYPTDLPHLRWMLIQLRNGGMSEGKAGRWLGWVQACLVIKGFFTLEEMKAHNMASSCEDEGCPHYNTLHVHQEKD